MNKLLNNFSVILTFLATIFSCNSGLDKKPSSKVLKRAEFQVNILPYKFFDTTLIEFTKNEVAGFYHFKVAVLRVGETPLTAISPLRNRIIADSLLKFQRQYAGSNNQLLIGLTGKDIATNSNGVKDWGVFGLGECPGKTCVISTFRLQRASATGEQLKERLAKVVLHEIGHNLGLPHCRTDIYCLMADAKGTISQVDREKKWLCNNCKQLLAR